MNTLLSVLANIDAGLLNQFASEVSGIGSAYNTVYGTTAPFFVPTSVAPIPGLDTVFDL